MQDFSLKRDFKSIQWKQTLILGFIRAALAGPIWFIFLVATGEPVFSSLVCIPLAPLMYFIGFLPLGLLFSFLSGIGVPGSGLLTIITSVFIAVGDPFVYILKQIKPSIVPVKDYGFINFKLIIFVLDNDLVGEATAPGVAEVDDD